MTAGETIDGSVEIRNTGDRTVTFLSGQPMYGYFVRGDRLFGGYSGIIAGKGDTVTVGPHATTVRGVRIEALACRAQATGGTSGRPVAAPSAQEPLSPGTYEVQAFINVSSKARYWHTHSVRVSVLRQK